MSATLVLSARARKNLMEIYVWLQVCHLVMLFAPAMGLITMASLSLRTSPRQISVDHSPLTCGSRRAPA